MIRLNKATILTIGLTLVGCTAADRPNSLTDPAVAQAAGETTVSHVLFESPVTTTLVTTTVEAASGVIPGVACYLNRASPYVAMTPLLTDASLGSECGVVREGVNFRGRARVPASYVNNGYTIRILLFWVPDAGWGAWN